MGISKDRAQIETQNLGRYEVVLLESLVAKNYNLVDSIEIPESKISYILNMLRIIILNQSKCTLKLFDYVN